MEFDQILTLIQAVSDSELTEFAMEQGDLKLSLSKKKKVVVAGSVASETTVPMVSVSAPVPEVKAEEKKEASAEEKVEGQIVTSPLVGTFYAAPSETAEPYVKVGDRVKKGQTIAIVEAMKLMNEIESEYDGVVAKILVENGKSVEYGQPLFIIQ